MLWRCPFIFNVADLCRTRLEILAFLNDGLFLAGRKHAGEMDLP